MVFSSITFLVFFLPTVIVFYYALPNLIYKNCVLFLASLLFYAWGEPKFVLLMFVSIVFNYNFGLKIGENTTNKKYLLAIAVLVDIGILFVFKYLGFSCKIINKLLTILHFQPLTVINLIMPIGISFYTFQELSYLVDVYRKPELAQKDLLNLGLYIAFFPQLIAGPIVRYHDINEQIQSRNITADWFAKGLERFIIGLSKKVLLANNFAVVCDSIYGANFFTYGTYTAWVAAVAYSLQIYYDFSGYSDMAIGFAKLFGFDLLENFNYPYAASSITDFWKRWHISLTNFFRDYVYIPLGGNRKGTVRTIINRYIVFFITGLWHGAAFNFIFWGLAHGSLMFCENVFNKKHPVDSALQNTKIKNKVSMAIHSILRHLYTLFFVMVLWIFFRNGIVTTIHLLLKMVGINYSQFTPIFRPIYYDELLSPKISLNFYFYASIGILGAFPAWRKFHFLSEHRFIPLLSVLKYMILVFLFVLCYANIAGDSYNPFIYFRF